MTVSPGRPAGPLAALRARLSGARGFASVGIVAVLLGSMLATVFGAGAASRVLNISDGNVWLWSSSKGEVGRVNTASGKVDQRVPLSDAKGHRVQVTQDDRHVLIHDLDTGQVTSLDLNQLGQAKRAKAPQGEGVRVVLAGDVAYLVNNLSGQVQQINPATLKTIGAPQNLAPPLSGGVADQTGRVWFAVPSQGTVVAVGSSTGDTDQGAQQAANNGPTGAQVLATTKVAAPGHSLAMTALRSGAAIIDTTDGKVSTIVGNKVASTVATSIRGPVLVPDHTDGVIPITQPDSRTVFLVNGSAVNQVQVPGKGKALGAAVVFGGRIYVADNTSHAVQIFGLGGQAETPISIPDANGPIELEVREDHLVINAPSSPHAVVVDGQGNKLDVDKYPPDVPGTTDAGESPAPPSSGPSNGGENPGGTPSPGNSGPPTNGGGGPNVPALTPPGSVSGLQASAGDKSVQLSWRRPSSGGAVNSYVISAEGRESQTVPASRRSVTIDGLTNGVEYRFSVTARNRVGSGPSTLSNPATPTGNVPGIPTNVVATPQKDGSVQVSWKDPLDKGPGITGHAINLTSANDTRTIEDAGVETSYTFSPKSLNYGDSYTFTVQATGLVTTGQPSEASPAVVPYTVPDAPAVEVKSNTATSVTFKWGTPKDNGKPLQPYQAVVNGQKREIPATQTEYVADQLTPGQKVNFSLTAVNEAGNSDTAQANAEADNPKPVITVTDKTSDSYTTAKVNFKVNWGGDGAPKGTCKVTINGKNAGTSCATGSVTVDRASKDYPFTITATSTTNKEDTATGDASSKTMTIHNSCDVAAAGNDCGLGILADVPQSDPDKLPKKGELGRNGQASAQCYGLGYRSQTGNQVTEHASENGGKGRQSRYWIFIPNAGGGYVVGAYLEEDDGTLNNLPQC
jgi:hypothetical protein